MIEDGKKGRVRRNAVRQKKRLWMTRIIPYYIPRHMSEYYLVAPGTITISDFSFQLKGQIERIYKRVVSVNQHILIISRPRS